MSVCALVCTCTCHGPCVDRHQESLFSPFAVCLVGLELRSPGFVSGIFSDSGISPAQAETKADVVPKPAILALGKTSDWHKRKRQ